MMAFVRHASGLKVILVSVLFLLANTYYVRATVTNPIASRNIYEQQYQMHRFVVDYYRDAVAVNDLGFVALASCSPRKSPAAGYESAF